MIEQISKIIAEQLCIDVSEVKPESHIMEDLNADSLAVVEILMAIEEQFGIKVPDEEVPSLKTVKDISDYVESHSV
ncbi:MAG: acyl carrier protein [Oscillospiraceae bacterium]|nr:acyl carrier protein [Oscillospiraceae bacterium]